uniref:Ig-like domain-containing protein n=1 Tax=Pseudonaja textilis TaxID=8673 RepID=A0A670ZY63_PSETE
SLPPSLPPSLPCSHVLSTQAQVVKYHLPVFMDRSNAIEGQGINLTVGAAPTSFFICNWYRGSDSQEKLIVTVYLPPLSGYVFGPAYTRRETPGPNCSLQIENLNQDDSGTYTLTHSGDFFFLSLSASGLLPKPNMSLVQLFRENMDLVHLKCDTTVKFANISWLQNGKPLRSCSRIQLSNNKQTLTIQPVLRRDAGAYQCHISNLFSARRSDTTIISVICEYPLPGTMSAMFLTQPSNGRLNCKASSFPEAEYCWFHNGKEFSKSPEILLKDIQSGTYTCQVGLAGSPNYSKFPLPVLWFLPLCNLLVIIICLLPAENLPKPNVIVKPTNFLMEFQPVWLYCNTTIIQEVSWFKDNILLGKGYDFTDFNRSLHVASVSPDNTGQYWCQVSNGITVVKSYPVFLSVIYGPGEPIISPVDVCNEEHTNIILSCKADAFPQPQYAWYRDGVWLDDGRRLFIQNFSEKNSGYYSCRATNPKSMMTGETTLEVDMIDFLPKPNVTAKPSNAIEELHPVHFFCNAPNDLMITWFKDRELYTNESHLLDNNKTLLIPSVTKNDTGGYQCQITNHTSTRISDIFNFNVVYGPDTPAIEPTQRYYNEHTKVLLTCKADSFPQPRYVWFHNGKKIDTGPKLFLEDFVEDKTGSYICQAGNDLLQKKRNSSSLEIYLEKSE